MATDHTSPKNSQPDDVEKLGFVRYTGDVPFDQIEFPKEPPNEDFEWAWNNPELQQKYAGKIIAIKNGTVWGVGRTHRDALQDAQRKKECPPLEELVLVGI